MKQAIPKAVEGFAFAHGLFIEGARWLTGDEAGKVSKVDGVPCAGRLAESKVKEILPQLPVIGIKAIPVGKNFEASPVGYLRNDKNCYEAPIYTTSMRGPTYITLATLKCSGDVDKWILAAVALLLQSDE